MVMRISSLALGLLLTAGLAHTQSSKPNPRITFSEAGLAINGVTAGGQVIWFGLERREVEYAVEITRHAEASLAAENGTSRLDLGRSSATAAVWIAVDLASGAYDVAVPEGFRLRRLPKPLSGLARKADAVDHLTDPRSYIEALIVRPGAGARTNHGGDGGVDDVDGPPDGKLALPLDRLVPLAEAPAAPAKAEDRDLWFVLEPNRLEISIQKGGVAQ